MGKIEKCAKKIMEVTEAIQNVDISVTVDGKKAPESVVDAIRTSIVTGIIGTLYVLEHRGEVDANEIAKEIVLATLEDVFDHEGGDDE